MARDDEPIEAEYEEGPMQGDDLTEAKVEGFIQHFLNGGGWRPMDEETFVCAVPGGFLIKAVQLVPVDDGGDEGDTTGEGSAEGDADEVEEVVAALIYVPSPSAQALQASLAGGLAGATMGVLDHVARGMRGPKQNG